MIKYVDFEGNITTEQWFREQFGAFTVTPNPDALYHVVRMIAKEGYPTFRIRVVDEDWIGIEGIPVTFCNGGTAVANTKPGGWAEFPMFRGSWYDLPGAGPHWVDETGGFERIDGIGMVSGTTYRHFEVVTKINDILPSPSPSPSASPSPSPSEAPPDIEAVLYAALAANEECRSHIQTALDLLQQGPIPPDLERIERILTQVLEPFGGVPDTFKHLGDDTPDGVMYDCS